jgi:ketosteroid isomerase-like protein
MRLLVILLFLPAILSGQRTVQASEDQRFAAIVRQDTVQLRHLLHDDLIYVHSNALIETKRDFIHSVHSGKIVYQAFNRTKMQVEQSGKMAIVNGEVNTKGLLNGNPFDVNLRYLAVYRKRKGQWSLYRWQSTRIP